MKRMGTGALCALLCLTLAACAGGPALEPPAPSPAAAVQTPSPSQTPAAASDPTPEPPQMAMLTDENAPARAAYAAALKKLLDHRILPDGTDNADGYIGSIAEREAMAENQFAVCDVDGDGREELVLLYTTTFVAGMRAFVYDWDGETGALRLQLEEFSDLTFYESGAVKAGWSHNQGKGGDFWPYFLYCYDPDADGYLQVGAVDAWDEGLGLEGYPADIDVSGSGFVYYLYEDLASEWDKIPPVDEAQYQAWLSPYLGEGNELPIPYLALTAENIHYMVTPG